MELKNGIKTFHAKTRKEWRHWLEENQGREKTVWLIMYHKGSTTPTITYEEAVEEALCFGWIDSKANKRDDESFYLYFAQRKPDSNWSKVNKERVAKMVEQGLMTASGQKVIDLAKSSGAWVALDLVEAIVIPDDLEAAFQKNKTAKKHFSAFPPSSKKMILQWILSAKRPDTRELRIKQTVELAAKNIRANHPLKKEDVSRK